MAKLLKLRRGTTIQHGSFTGAEGEVTIDTTKDTAVVHDGTTQSGRALLREDVSNLADQAIQLNHLPHGTGSNDGKFLRANNGADPTYETVNTDLVADTSPQLGGTLDTNSQDVDFKGSDGNTKILWDVSQDQLELADSTTLTFGDHTGTGDYNISYVNGADFTILGMNGGSGDLVLGTFASGTTTKNLASIRSTGAIEAYYGGSKKFETTTGGVSVTGAIVGSSTIACTSSLSCTGANIDNQIIINGQVPRILFTDSDGDPDYKIELNGGTLSFTDTTNSATRLSVGTTGINVTGNITATGTVKGRDLTTDGNKLDGIAAGAIANLVEDTSPQLGGQLDSNNFDIKLSDGEKLLLHDHGSLSTKTAATTAVQSGLTGYVTQHSTILDGGSQDIWLTTTGNAITIGTSDSTTYETARFECAALGASKHGYCQLNYVTANAGQNAVSQTKLQTTATGVNVTGALVATGDVTAFSDKTLKTEISTINDALSTVGKLRGVSYKWLKDGKPSIGVIAQEVEEVIPEVVHTTEYEGKNVKSVDYGKLVGVLIEAVKELKTEVEKLKGGK